MISACYAVSSQRSELELTQGTMPALIHDITSIQQTLLSKTTYILHINLHMEQFGAQCFSRELLRNEDQSTNLLYQLIYRLP